MNGSAIEAQSASAEVEVFPGGTSRLSPEDRAALQRAVRELERTSLAIRLSAILGEQARNLASFIPAPLADMANRAAQAAIRVSFNMALKSLAGKPLQDRRRLHKSLAVFAGAAGGAFGVSSLPLELPFSTTILLRSVADIARSEGHDLEDPRAVLACLEVFALGGRAASGGFNVRDSDAQEARLKDGAYLETGYFALRAILAKSVSEAASYLAGRGTASMTAPALVRFVAQIGTHFGVAVSQKFVAQTVPLIGAAGGAAINYAFADHFQTIARGHFTVMR
ncbi:MAG TPA: EcsC family protein, partial [Methylocella sp.]|nr:EcsC family protein [Methylocella sp.]